MARCISHLIGLAPPDGHIRITQGEGLTLQGGTERVHERMQEHAIRLTEKLKSRGKTIQSASSQEIVETLHEVSENT